jgi:hypothetical protein
MSQFYDNLGSEALEEYEFLGEKKMTAILTLDQKMLVFINMREYGDLFGGRMVQVVCEAYTLKRRLSLVYSELVRRSYGLTSCTIRFPMSERSWILFGGDCHIS